MIDVSMYQFFMQNYSQKKDFCAVSFLYKNFSYKYLCDEIDTVACFLKNNGINKGDVVTIALPNIPSSISAFYAINKVGAVANMVHPLVPYDLLKEYMLQTNSKILFAFDILIDGYFNKLVDDGFDVVVCKANDYLTKCESFFYNTFAKKKCKNINKTKCKFFADAQKTKVYDIKQQVLGDDVAIIMHSSGTTQKSKSALLTNKNFNYVANSIIQIFPWGKKLCDGLASLAVLPTFHAFGMGVTTHTMLVYGYNTVMIPKYSAKLIAKKLKSKNVVMLAGVPTMFAGLVEQKNFDGKHLKKLKFAFCGGDNLPAKVKNKFDEVVSKNGGSCVLAEGYGLTEASGVLSVNTKQANKDGSVGKPIKGTTVGIFDENCNKLSNNVVGQICVSSPAIMKGYLQNGKIVCDCCFEFKGKVFIKTGDLGYMDEDGFIFFKQRQKRVEKVSGVNVFPAEAEQVLLSIDGVKNCCVKGVPHDTKGAVMKAFVVLCDGVDKDKIYKEIKMVCAQKLNKWTQPKIYQFVDSLPLTKFGKIDYNKL